MANNSQPMSLPSRLALWLGVAFVLYGFYKGHPILTWIGNIFVLAGGALWWLYHARWNNQTYAFWTKKFWATRWEWLKMHVQQVRIGKIKANKQITKNKKKPLSTPLLTPRHNSEQDQHKLAHKALDEGKDALKNLDQTMQEHGHRHGR